MTIHTTQELGAAVRLCRKKLNITQRDLALSCGTGLRFIIDLEKGKPTCQVGKTLVVLKTLGMAIEARLSTGVGKADDRA